MTGAEPTSESGRARGRSEAARAGVEQARQRGVTLGRPRSMPAAAPAVEKLLSQGLSYKQVADQLNADQVPTAKGGPWTRASVQNIAIKLGVAASPRVRAAKDE